MNPNPTPYIIWGSMGTTHLVLLVVATQVLSTGADESLARVLVPLAVAVATVSIVLGFRSIAPGLSGPPRSIIRWGLAEAATIFGLVAQFVSGQPLYLYACAAFGLLAWAAAFPSDAARWPTDSRGRGEG